MINIKLACRANTFAHVRGGRASDRCEEREEEAHLYVNAGLIVFICRLVVKMRLGDRSSHQFRSRIGCCVNRCHYITYTDNIVVELDLSLLWRSGVSVLYIELWWPPRRCRFVYTRMHLSFSNICIMD